MSAVEWAGVALCITTLAYFFGLSKGHALACSRIAILAEREKLCIGDAVKALATERVSR